MTVNIKVKAGVIPASEASQESEKANYE